MSTAILDIRPFPQPKTTVDFMILPLPYLLATKHDYPMDTPQRLHFYMIVLFTKGKGQHFVDFEAYPYGEKTLLFVAENQVQQWEINLENEAFVVAFSKEFLYKNSQDREILERYRIFDFSLQSPTILLRDADYDGFLLFFQELNREFARTDSDSFKSDILRNLLRTILLRAERLKCAEEQPAVLSQYRDFIRFKERVEADYTRTRNVQDYAEALGYSPKRLNQLSKAVLNKGAKAFIDERTILEVKRLLIHTDLSIKEIADHIGFDEPTNLIKFFKRYTQQTPKMFRESISHRQL